MATIFGTMNSGTPDGKLFKSDVKVKITKALGVDHVRLGFRLDNYTDSNKLMNEYIASGFKILLNISEKTVSTDDITGKKIPNPYCTDVKKFTTQLETIILRYKDALAGVAIENEPYNKNYYTGPISNYITQLKACIEVCKRMGVKITDGGLNAESINAIQNGVRYSKGSGIARNKELLDGYKGLGLDWVNVHTYGRETGYPAGRLKKVADYLRSVLGIPVVSNEWGIYANSPDLVKNMMQQFHDAEILYAIFYNGGTKEGGSRAITDIDGNLLQTGQAFFEMVQKLKPIVEPEPEPEPQPTPEQSEFRNLLSTSADVSRFFELFGILTQDSTQVDEFLELANSL